MILDDIIAAKKREVSTLKKTMPLSGLKAAVRDFPPSRDFKSAVGGGGSAIIAEIKRRSPSKGILREDFDPLRIAMTYENNGASALSVLTDQEFFGGHKSYLAEIKKTVRLPLLRKDFIIDPYQIYETKCLQGDALLLIAGLLEEERLRDYIDLADSLGISALVEVHSREELDKALAAGATLIGINNRNLKTFSTDLTTTLDLAPSIPKDRIIISESGIRCREDIEILTAAGVHAFLIGESLMKAEDIGKKLRELLGRD